MTYDEALKLLLDYTETPGLQKHAFAVEAAMRAYARKFQADEEQWAVTGLLHDFDYEKYPETHPYKGCDMLREMGVDDAIVQAIMGHAVYTGVLRETLMARALFAVDELCGFITAVTLVRPNKALSEVTVKSVKKKMKDKRFAAKVNRDEMRQGAMELGVEFDEHVRFVIDALKPAAERLGLGS
ncbi:MAG: HDIG domain-containing protein [Calditrichaeota bacterium]|nr:MAG: HDIG domain-containing protein [Calditrichota bacterium]